ncbi:sulfatase-like hydrolase/transferase [bacterium]|nr:sulfatase-like hydrolase/transferase [bacterium]
MNRRDFLRATGATAALLSTGALAQAKQPNLVIIHTDEHNFRTLGCYRALEPKAQALMWGKTVCKTPHIDSLARNGALCTRFYATTPVCSPSRAAFVSGRYPQNTPVTTNNIPLADGIVTFAEILRRKGYATGYAGKWHIDGSGKPQWEPKRKFGFADNRYMFNRGHWKQLEDTPDGPRVKARKGNKPNYDVKGADAKSFTTDFLCDKAVDFIKANRGKPFCYMVSLPDPHGPNSVRLPYDTRYADAAFTAPPSMSKPAAGAPSWAAKQVKGFNGKLMASYYGMVECIDDNVGKILSALKKAGVLDDTIVVFTADHGDLCFEHARHNKGVPLEASAKVPFVIAYPGRIKGGTVVNQALTCVDFLPTALALMGVETAGKEQGRDASALFLGNAIADWKDVAFFRGTGKADSVNWLAAVTSRYKIVFSPRDEPWLIDLKEDPNELKNLLRDPKHRDLVRSLSCDLIAYCRKYNDHYGSHPRIAADLAWGAEGAGDYVAPDVPAAKPKAARKRGKARKKE